MNAPVTQGWCGSAACLRVSFGLPKPTKSTVPEAIFRLFNLLLPLFRWSSTGLLAGLFSITQPAIGQSGINMPLAPTPRASFTPTPPQQKGYWNIDVVGDFQLPASKSITFNAAGRNLHVQQDWEKLFRRGFTAVERTRMTLDEMRIPIYNEKPPGWQSRLVQSRRALILAQNYFYDPPTNPYNLRWAQNSELAPYTYFKRSSDDPNRFNSLGQAVTDLADECMNYGDCPPGQQKNTYNYIFLDIENEGTSFGNRQEQTNLYVYMMKVLKENVSAATTIGSIAPVPHNSYGFTRLSDYAAQPDWLWSMTAQHTDAQPSQNILSSKVRGMPDSIVGKSFSDYADFQMPGVYYVSQSFNYAIPHNGEVDQHWLAALLGEQEVNRALSPKKRIAWQWLFNTQSDLPGNSGKANYPAPPAIAEGTAIFYWFTGADGVLFWDDANELTPNQSSLPDSDPQQGLGSDRNYACYEHYLHGLWRIFNHHRDLFDGRETYLNEKTECSFDNGQTWHQYNAGELKRRGLPYARSIVNGNQILIAATAPYAGPGQATSMMVRYLTSDQEFVTQINLTGDEVFLGRGTIARRKTFAMRLCQGCAK